MTTRRSFGTALLSTSAMLVSACSTLPDWSLFLPFPSHETSAMREGPFHFSWRLSGDRRAGPLQVFDDGRSIWLQFEPGQPIPAVFGRGEHGDQLLTHRMQGAYAVVDGIWPLLVMRAGGLESRAERLTPEPAHSQATPQELPPAVAGRAAPESLATELHIETVPETAVEHVVASEPVIHEAAFPVAEARPQVTPSYRVSPENGNLRQTLMHWAKTAGWTFDAEHWAVDADIPVVGSAEFALEFGAAVQQLLASTELSELPLQPCFYANKVLRVVPYAQSCDRSAPLGRA